MHNIWLFISVTFFISASPGPAMLTALADAARFGLRHALFSMLGICVGNLILISFSIFGLALLLKQEPLLFEVLKFCGAAYLAFLGLRLLLSGTSSIDIDLSTIKVQRHHLFIKALLVAVSNPKGLIFFGALFPQFIEPGQPLTRQLVVLSILFLCMDFTWMLSYAYGGKVLLNKLKSPGFYRAFKLCCGLALCSSAFILSLTSLS